jgi:hypothetical protein
MTATKQFKGYKTTIGGRVAFVVNEGTKDGKRILKVKWGRLTGYAGWSGGAYPQYSFAGNAVWVAAE